MDRLVEGQHQNCKLQLEDSSKINRFRWMAHSRVVAELVWMKEQIALYTEIAPAGHRTSKGSPSLFLFLERDWH